MKHLAQIQMEFLKSATTPDWWKSLPIRDQKRYLREHRHTNLRLHYPPKNINGLSIGKVDERNFTGSSYKGEIDVDLRVLKQLFGQPNKTTEDGHEWFVKVGPRLVSIYNGEKRHGLWKWHVGGFIGDEIKFLNRAFGITNEDDEE